VKITSKSITQITVKRIQTTICSSDLFIHHITQQFVFFVLLSCSFIQSEKRRRVREEKEEEKFEFWTEHFIFVFKEIKNNSILWNLISQNFEQPGFLVLVCCFH